MRILAQVMTLTFVLAQVASQGTGTTIQGAVKRAGDGTGIANAQVRLVLTGEVPAVQSEFLKAIPAGIQFTPQFLEAISAAITAAPRTPFIRTAGTAPAPQYTEPFTVITDADGRFAFRNVPSGKYAIAAQCDGYFDLSLPGAVATTIVTTSPIDVTANGS